ncbi:phage minor head protein [Flavitalea sp.]|nr:phage minor head protein [Flavitalea sp.]
MTRTERNKKAQEYKRILTAIETRYITRVYTALKSQISSLTEVLKASGIDQARSHLNSFSFNLKMTAVVRDMHLKAGLWLANRTYSGLLAASPQLKYRTFGYNEQWTEEILRYFRLHLLESVNNISETTKAHILKIMERGISEGLSVDEMVRLINDKVYLGHRAQVIVRTESNRAANYGTIVAAGAYDYQVVKEWISIPDNRRRHSHLIVEGEMREMDQPYSIGLMYPGDPEGPLKEIILCRCLQAIVPKRDEQGRLIPKIMNPIIQGRQNEMML